MARSYRQSKSFQMDRAVQRIVLLLTFLCLLGGCASEIAMSKSNYPSIPNGSRRAMIYEALGDPMAVCNYSESELIEVFKIRGKSSNYDRSVGHGMMDSNTLYLWEIVATPYELIRYPFDKFSTHFAAVRFDRNGQSTGVNYSYAGNCAPKQ